MALCGIGLVTALFIKDRPLNAWDRTGAPHGTSPSPR